MNKEQQIKELKETIEKAQKQINDLSKPESNKRWRSQLEGWYYTMQLKGVELLREDNDDFDEARYKLNNYFETKEEAQQELDKQLAIVKINDRIKELNDGWTRDNTSRESSWYVTYDILEKSFNVFSTNDHVYIDKLLDMQTKEIAEQIVREFTKELKLIMNLK